MIGSPLGKRLQRAGAYSRRWQGELLRLMCEARAEGASLREIAELVGLSHETVRQATTEAAVAAVGADAAAHSSSSCVDHHMPIANA